jgi:hypothetical protein
MMKVEGRKEKIKAAIFSWPYSGIFAGTFVSFFVLNVYLNQSFFVFSNLMSLALWFSISFTFFTLLVAFLVALNINLMIMKVKLLRGVGAGAGGVALAGTFGGIIGGSCPACFVGLFPAMMGLFGVTASLSMFPFQGLEIQAVSAVLLIVSIRMLSAAPVCKIKRL